MRKLTMLLLAALLLPATLWAGGATEPGKEATGAQPAAAAASSGKYKEAPMLAEMVKAGKLPPVEKRLPDNPLVIGQNMLVKGDDLKVEVGKYGGPAFKSITTNASLDWNLRDAAMENWLSSPAHTTGPVYGNVAESFSINDDNTVFTLTIRKGLKWSDGQPVTTEDVRFGWEDVQNNKDITPILPSNYRAGGKAGAEPMKLEILDQYTFRMIFAKPYGRFIDILGLGNLWGSYTDIMKPAHYLKKYHTKYTPVDQMAAELKAANLTDKEWFRLFLAKDILWTEVTNANAAGFPSLGAWVPARFTPDRMIMERNPYYYKVDAAGNQLPYVDRYEATIVSDPEVIPLKIIAGEINLNRDLIVHDKVPLLKDNEAKGNYKIDLRFTYHNAPVALFLNYNHKDPVWTEVVLNKKFRQAINMGMNTKGLLDTVFLGMGKRNPWFPQEYNVQKANALLDEMGMNKRDSEGYRLSPSGKRFEFLFEYKEEAADWQRMGEVIRADIEKLGIRTPMKKLDNTLWTQRRDASELYATLDWLDDVNWPYLKYDYTGEQRCKWAQKWHDWVFTAGKSGIEPPDWIKELYAIDEEIRAVRPGTARADAAEKKFAAWMMEYIPMFPVARDIVSPMVVPTNLGNLATKGRSSATQFAAEIYYYK